MKQRTRGFSPIFILFLVVIAGISVIIFYTTQVKERETINEIHTASGVYKFQEVFKIDTASLKELETVFKENYQKNRTYEDNIHDTDYYPFASLSTKEVRNSMLIYAQESNNQIVSYCVVYGDRPNDPHEKICIDTENPENVPKEDLYSASFLAKLKPYKF